MNRNRRILRRILGAGGLVAIVALLGAAVATNSSRAAANSGTLPESKQRILDFWKTPPLGGATTLTDPLSRIPACPAPDPGPFSGKIVNPSREGLPVTIPTQLYDVTTEWSGIQGNLRLTIYGGVERADATQGVIIYQLTNDCTGGQVDGGQFTTPSKAGSVTLTSVAGHVVGFSDSAGSGSFDLNTHQFGSQ